jgi:DNA polymerase I-like protein with 3'-5' exonuclease and polymerase domains
MLENVDLKELKRTRSDLVEAIIQEYIEEHGEGKKTEKKEEVSTPSVTLKDVQEAATKAAETATTNVLKEMKAKDDDASHLSDVIESVEASLKECNVDDKVRAVLRESMLPFALKEFGKVGDEIDAKKLAERRDELLDTLRGIASLLKESKDEKKGGEEKKGADKTGTLVERSL